ncbi:MAG: WD40/YVTN/BNR-like repeat-containing protein, partial [Terriglobales bacterium]
DGVFRSRDAGKTWEQISPPNHAEIHNIESVAIDPRNPDSIYAGTWHLPWKTDDGGRNWHSIKNGLIDDSDVFSIKVDPVLPQVVYLSACSGIYKSENAGELFHKIQGIPATARRTRVLQQDPSDSLIVYAGTTEGLWKTVDAGKTWKRMGPANLIINDVMVDPRNPQRVLLATDRSGVLASDDGGASTVASNRGFSHRQVSAMVASHDGQTLYAGVVNDKEFGGVFSSTDAGAHWRQVNNGFAGEDIFSLALADDGTLIAGTNRGIFVYDPQAGSWAVKNLILNETFTPAQKVIKKKRIMVMERKIEKGELRGRVLQIATTVQRWFAATPSGLYISLDHGNSWHGGAIDSDNAFVSVSASGDRVAASTASKLLLSNDGGNTWKTAHLPDYVTRVYRVSMEPKRIWIDSREGAFFSTDDGDSWHHVIVGMPAMQVVSVKYDGAHDRTLAVATDGEIFGSADGLTWTRTAEPGRELRSVAVAGDRLYGITQFSGIVADSEAPAGERSASSAMIGKQ